MTAISSGSGWIYAFKDAGFDRGIKIGRDRNRTDRFKIAQCYSPRGIELVALWHVEAPKNGRGDAAFAAIEAQARSRLRRLETADGGGEWVDATADEAIDGVSAALGVRTEATWVMLVPRATYCDFRSPKRIDEATKYRQLLWAFVENKTGRIKLQRSDMWNCPLRERRTYSLLGFPAVKCWGFEDPAMHVAGNPSIHDVWRRAVEEIGFGEKDVRVGWLKEGVGLEEIEGRVVAARMAEVDISDYGRKPVGLRPNDYRA